jgi:hypothetical protein
MGTDGGKRATMLRWGPFTKTVPTNSAKFCEVIKDSREAMTSFTNESSPIKRAQMRKPEPYEFEPRIEAVFGASGRFDNWTGTVRFHIDGRHVAVSFFPDCQGFPQAIEFATANRSSSAQRTATR